MHDERINSLTGFAADPERARWNSAINCFVPLNQEPVTIRPAKTKLTRRWTMRSAKSTARTLGVLLLLQMACGLIVPFVLWHPLIVGSPAFLTAAAANSFQIRAGVFPLGALHPTTWCRCVDLSVLPFALAFRPGSPRAGHSGIDGNLAAVHGSHITGLPGLQQRDAVSHAARSDPHR